MSGVSAYSPSSVRDVRPVQTTCGCDGTPHSHRLIVKVFIFSGKMESSRSTTYGILHSKYKIAGYILEIKKSLSKPMSIVLTTPEGSEPTLVII